MSPEEGLFRTTGAAMAVGCVSTLAISVRPRPRVEQPHGDLAEHGDRDHERSAEQQGELHDVRVDRDERIDVQLEVADEELPDPSELEDEVDCERRSEA